MPSPGYILIVDDSNSARRGLAAALEDAGYCTVSAADGAEALAWLAHADPPAVILLDLEMRGMNGWDFREQQQQDPRLAAIPVVIVSGEAQLERQAVALRVAGSLPKPIDLPTLLGLLRPWCGSGPGRS